MGARLLSQPYQYPNFSEGADRVGGQLRGDKECPFSGVTKSGTVWRKVPESDTRSVAGSLSVSVDPTTELSDRLATRVGVSSVMVRDTLR